jgi:hypothetical protein
VHVSCIIWSGGFHTMSTIKMTETLTVGSGGDAFVTLLDACSLQLTPCGLYISSIDFCAGRGEESTMSLAVYVLNETTRKWTDGHAAVAVVVPPQRMDGRSATGANGEEVRCSGGVGVTR